MVVREANLQFTIGAMTCRGEPMLAHHFHTRSLSYLTLERRNISARTAEVVSTYFLNSRGKCSPFFVFGSARARRGTGYIKSRVKIQLRSGMQSEPHNRDPGPSPLEPGDIPPAN